MLVRRAKKAAFVVSLAYAGVVGAVALFYRALLYPAPKSGLEPTLSGATLEKIEPAAEGDPATVYALWAKAPAGAPTVVLFHGNGEELVDEVSLVRSFMDRGVGVLAVEYPGYGLAKDQSPSEAAIYRAAERALAFLDGRGVAKTSVTLVGFSLGSGVAAEMAKRGYGKRLVLLAPYTSIVDMVSRWVPIVPTSLVVGDRFDTLAKASRLALPTLVVHGDADPVIPVAMGRKVAAALPNAELTIVPGGHHNDLFVRDPTLAARIASFASGSAALGAGPPAKSVR